MEKAFKVTCTLVGLCNREYAEYTIGAKDEYDVRRKLKDHIKKKYPKSVAYKWEPFSLQIRRINDI